MKKVFLFSLMAVMTLVLVFSVGCSSGKTVKNVADSAQTGPGKTYAATTGYAAMPQVTLTVPPMTSNPRVTTTMAGVKTPLPTPTPGIPGGSQNNAVDQSTRMVIRTGNIQMVVNQISPTLENITQIANSRGGYVISSQQWKEGDRNIGSMSIRVLAENYDAAMADIRMLAKSVTNESTTSQDVTEEYTDLNSRVKNLEATETQLLKIMENAAKTEDILSIQRELTNVRGEIEQIKGRMLYLERTSSTSLINIRMEEAVLAIKFNASQVSAGTNTEIRFNCDVIGGFAPYSYSWDFGDGQTSVAQSPSHSYKEAGNYSVVLTVTDDKGYTNTLVRNSYINIVSAWKPGTVAQNAWNGLTVFAKGLVNVLIWVGIFSFIWIPAGALIWYFAYFRRRRKHL